MIDISNLTYRYNRKKTLFDGLNLQLFPGKVYGLLGKNGAGKSSLIKNIAGFLLPASGHCRVYGHESGSRDTGFLEQLFFIPEECELPRLRIPDFINIYGPFYPGFNNNEFHQFLDGFQVSADSRLDQLSFGQKKKAYIAFAFATNTNVLIMDEPTNGLDIPSKVQFRKIASAVDRKNKITIMSTHQVRDLDDLISSILIINNSEILLNEDKDEIIKKLHFSLGDDHNGGTVIFEEQTALGKACLSTNDNKIPSYLDLEILFNATLAAPAVMGDLFNKSSTN